MGERHPAEECRARLLGQVETMVSESGDPDGFDAAAWLSRWLNEPLPAFGGRCPAVFLETTEGQELVAVTLSCMQSGAYIRRKRLGLDDIINRTPVCANNSAQLFQWHRKARSAPHGSVDSKAANEADGPIIVEKPPDTRNGPCCGGSKLGCSWKPPTIATTTADRKCLHTFRRPGERFLLGGMIHARRIPASHRVRSRSGAVNPAEDELVNEMLNMRLAHAVQHPVSHRLRLAKAR